jgi:hypothetical protein
MDAGDWAAGRAFFAPGAQVEDHRRLVRTQVGAEVSLAAIQDSTAAVTDMRIERRLVAVFGDRLSLEHQLWRGSMDGGACEIEMLSLIEVDDQGCVTAIVSFDAGDTPAAHREATERWAAMEPALAPLLRTSVAYGDAVRDRDVDRLRALVTDDVVSHDWRYTGAGLIEGADAFVEAIGTLWKLTLAADGEMLIRLAIEPFGSVSLVHQFGDLLDGGSFDRITCSIAITRDGRFERFEHFEIEDVERALARFEDLRAARPITDTR